jgi:DNA-binding NtrC family response regulator
VLHLLKANPYPFAEVEHAISSNQAAQYAGVERTHLYRKLQSLRLDPKQEQGEM